MRLENKTAIVTGAGRGLGRGIAKKLAREGARVVVADMADTDETVAEIIEAGGAASGFQVNVSRQEEVQALIQYAVDTYGGLDIMVTECYSLLGLISYLTAGEKETRAWTIEKGTKAPQAAGKIHSDFERGFIRAEIVDYKILLELGSYTIAKEKGKVRSEGKDYVVQDGDVVLFRFNV